MAELTFRCTQASASRYAATPTLSFKLSITEGSGVRVHAIALRCQIRIEPHRRRYSAAEAQRLHDLFGDTSRWADTVKPIQLAMVSTMVPAFTSLTEVGLQVPCTYDLEVASARYLQGLDDALSAFKAEHALVTWDATLTSLLARARRTSSSPTSAAGTP